MFKKKLKELLDFAQKTDLREVHWEKKDLLIRFQRAAAPMTASVSDKTEFNGEVESPESQSSTIRSTMVGTFFRSDSPDRPPFVVEGTIVASSQPVAAIEAMKIMKDVLSPMPCKIVKVLVANGHPVEYGQPLFQVEPANEKA